MGAGTLSDYLKDLKTPYDPDLLVGFDSSDDACVYRVSEDTAVIQTADFFPPIVDDPYDFGQIAAANALSDVYAMGGVPKLALNLMSVTDDLKKEEIQAILRGGYDKALEAGVLIAGGHTIKTAEPVYGLAVTGFIHPQKILKNNAVTEGDVLILTKPLGSGLITTAAKAGIASEEEIRAAVYYMKQLNQKACSVMLRHTVSSCTDITGFGLLGHAAEMAEGSSCSLQLSSGNLRTIDGALSYAAMGMIPAGAYRNRQFTEGKIRFIQQVPSELEDVMYDPQTSGGLFFGIREEEAQTALRELADEGIDACIAGCAVKKQEAAVLVQ